MVDIKFVSEHKGKLFSMLKGTLPPAYVVEYSSEEWARGVYPLFYYSGQFDLERIRRDGVPPYQAWYCEVQGGERLQGTLLGGISTYAIEQFWKTKPVIRDLTPLTTVWIATSIRLTERIA